MTRMSQHLARMALVGAIALSPLAHAQGTLSTYGLLDLSVGRSQAPGAAAVKAVESGKMTTSHLGFRGTEALADGWSAVFVLEHFLRTDTGAAGRFDGDVFWARNAFVGLSSNSLGAVHAGRITTSLFVNTLRFNPFGDSFGFSPNVRHFFASGTVSGDSAWSDSIRYTSPTFGGAAFTVHVAAGEGNGGRNAGLSGQYGSGPLALAAAWQKVEKGATVADTTTWQLSGAYDFKVVKVFAQYGEVDNDTTNNGYKIAELGASVPVGGHGNVLIQWGQIDPKTGAKRSTVSAGYGYHLSKRTDLYAIFMSDKLSGLSTGNSYGVGVRHRF